MKLEWHLERRPLSEIKGWPDNPRKVSRRRYKALQASLDKYGLAQPLIVEPDGMLIGGHRRLEALTDAGIQELDCYVPSRPLTPDEHRELAIRLNANVAGDWDWPQFKGPGWDMKKLTEWGLPSVFPADMPEGPGKEIKPRWGVYVDVEGEAAQKTLYEEFTGRGLKCRLMTL